MTSTTTPSSHFPCTLFWRIDDGGEKKIMWPLKKGNTTTSLHEKKMDAQPGIGSVFSETSQLVSKATSALSGRTAKMTNDATTPMKSLAVSIIVVLVLIIALGMGRGVAKSYCEKSTNHEVRIGRAVTSIEDGMFMVLGFLILLPLAVMQGRHFTGNWKASSVLTKVSWASWMGITLAMLATWSVATANYWSTDDKEEGRGKAVGTVFHVAVVIVVGLLALLGSGTAAIALR